MCCRHFLPCSHAQLCLLLLLPLLLPLLFLLHPPLLLLALLIHPLPLPLPVSFPSHLPHLPPSLLRFLLHLPLLLLLLLWPLRHMWILCLLEYRFILVFLKPLSVTSPCGKKLAFLMQLLPSLLPILPLFLSRIKSFCFPFYCFCCFGNSVGVFHCEWLMMSCSTWKMRWLFQINFSLRLDSKSCDRCLGINVWNMNKAFSSLIFLLHFRSSNPSSLLSCILTATSIVCPISIFCDSSLFSAHTCSLSCAPVSWIFCFPFYCFCCFGNSVGVFHCEWLMMSCSTWKMRWLFQINFSLRLDSKSCDRCLGINVWNMNKAFSSLIFLLHFRSSNPSSLLSCILTATSIVCPISIFCDSSLFSAHTCSLSCAPVSWIFCVLISSYFDLSHVTLIISVAAFLSLSQLVAFKATCLTCRFIFECVIMEHLFLFLLALSSPLSLLLARSFCLTSVLLTVPSSLQQG